MRCLKPVERTQLPQQPYDIVGHVSVGTTLTNLIPCRDERLEGFLPGHSMTRRTVSQRCTGTRMAKM